MSDVMISYSRRDGDFVRRLHQALADAGREIWVDWQDIPLSADWWDEIARAIEASDTFVFVISPDSLGSPICNLEIAHARENNKRIVPILYRDAELDDAIDLLGLRELGDNVEEVLGEKTIEQVARENWNTVSRHNWLFFQDQLSFEENIQRLVDVIDTDLDHAREHTRLLVRAREWQNRSDDASYLLSGGEISDAESWLGHGVNKDPVPTTLHADYIAASRRAANDRQRRLLSGVTIGFFVAVALMILSFVLAVYANNQRTVAVASAATATVAQGEAIVQANIAATNESIANRNAAEANSLLWASYAEDVLQRGDSPLALSLALAAVEIQDPPSIVRRTLADVAFAAGPRRLFDAVGAEINAVDYSPDGNTAAVALSDRRVVLYDLNTGEVQGQFSGNTVSVSALDYSPSGETILSVSFNNLILFDVETLNIVREMQHGSGTFVNTVAISPDETRALSGALDNTIVLWDLETGEEIRTLRGHTGAVNSVTFNANGTQALSGSSDDTMRLWDLETGEVIRQFNSTSDILSVDIGRDGSTAVSGSQLGDVIYWNMSTGTPIFNLSENSTIAHTLPVTSVAFSPDGIHIVSGGEDQLVIVWRTSNGSVDHIFDAHDASVTSVAFSPDGDNILSGSTDSTMYVWSVHEEGVSQQFFGHTEEVLSAVFSPDGEQVLASDLDGTVLLWSVAQGRTLQRYLPGDDTQQTINVLRYTPAGDTFVMGGDDGILALWDVATWSIEQTLEAHTRNIIALDISADGSMMVSADESGMVVLWDMPSGEMLYELGTEEINHNRDVVSVTFNSDGTRLLTGSQDRQMILWDTATGEPIQSYPQNARVISVAFAAHETQLYAATNNDEIVVWDVNSAEIVEQIPVGIEGVERSVSQAAFYPETESAVVGRVDGGVMLWNLRDRSAITFYNQNQDEGSTRNLITALSFSPNGLMSIVGGRNGSLFIVRTLSLAELVEWTRSNRYIPEPTCEERELYNVIPLCEDTQAVAAVS